MSSLQTVSSRQVAPHSDQGIYKDKFIKLKGVLKDRIAAEGHMFSIGASMPEDKWRVYERNNPRDCKTALFEAMEWLYTNTGSYKKAIELMKKGLATIERNDLLYEYKAYFQ
ncbi:hypothetical protein CI610_01571 [invertebrate metagenome]|uniref:Uncharacterized protein n=1 Tax=invertebrate metagenome TaxID=1711999 RepID=A0A2H9T873_9ZZZZ